MRRERGGNVCGYNVYAASATCLQWLLEIDSVAIDTL